ncbi:hypothetical protein PENSTE_c011G01100 [Penicillium steckii]|uniref:Uncharacterized protein n=1 Tax=Penicillium steckii TaxID=303698 RepID=A0A1V6T625_9EURO|nr:hypothetical protein PENSTE_c011G01100 [Penicillium steckii]
MESKITIHHGPYETIPEKASPGLSFLKSFLPALDTLDPASNPLTPFFTPNAPILVGSNPPSTANATIPLLDIRSRHLSHFHHQVHIAWDIDLSEIDRPNTSANAATIANENENTNPNLETAGAGASASEGIGTSDKTTLYNPLPGAMRMKRTVMFEATSCTMFKGDPDEFRVKVREFNILDLEGDVGDLQVVEMRVFMDGKPVQARAQELSSGFAFGEGVREAEPS